MARQDQIERLDLNVHTHLSYPFTYPTDEHVVCLPEMAAERRQVMYVLNSDTPPRELCLVAENVAMADPTLFEYGGLYWIAYNDADLGLHENLCLRFAARLDGPWISASAQSGKGRRTVLASCRYSIPPWRQPISSGAGLFGELRMCIDDKQGHCLYTHLLRRGDGRNASAESKRAISVWTAHVLGCAERHPGGWKAVCIDWNILLQRLAKRLRRTRTSNG